MLQILKEANGYISEKDNTTPTLQSPQNKRVKKKKKKNFIMETKLNSNNFKPIDKTHQIEDTDPITTIFKIQATKNEKKPLFVLKEEIRHLNSEMEFVFEVCSMFFYLNN